MEVSLPVSEQRLVVGNDNVMYMPLLWASLIERRRQVYSTQSISPDPHEVAKFYAAV
jgi:hypothetical protein